MAGLPTGKILRDQFVKSANTTEFRVAIAPHPLSDHSFNFRIDIPSAFLRHAPQEKGDFISLHFVSADFEEDFYYLNISPTLVPDGDEGSVRRILFMVEFAQTVSSELAVRMILDGTFLDDLVTHPVEMNSAGQEFVYAEFLEQDGAIKPVQRRVRPINSVAPGDPAAAMPKYCYLSGTQKSGTTWLENIMNLDARSIILHEANTASFFDPSKCGVSSIRTSDELKHVPWYPKAVTADRFLDSVRSATSSHILNHYRKLWGAELVGDRTPGVTTYLHGILRSWAEPRVAHIVRNPLDVAISWLFHDLNHFRKTGHSQIRNDSANELCTLLYSGRASEKVLIQLNFVQEGIFDWILDQWNLDQETALELQDKYPDRFLIVKYENILDMPGYWINELYRFFGIDLSIEEQSAYAERADFRQFSGGRKPGQKDGKSFYRSGVANDYTNYFQEDVQVALFQRCSSLARSFGYDL